MGDDFLKDNFADDNFDFGFTAVDENELEVVSKVHQEANEAAANEQITEEKLNRMYNAILPLLENLKKDSDKDYILWPDRVAKIEAFKNKLDTIMGM